MRGSYADSPPKHMYQNAKESSSLTNNEVASAASKLESSGPLKHGGSH